MLVLVLRRAVAQRQLLAAVAALVAVACTLVGTCALVLDVTQDRAFREAARQLPADDVSVTAFLVDLDSAAAPAAREEAGRVVGGVLAGLRPTLESTTTSRLRELAGEGRSDSQGYLVATDALAARADLTSGRWARETAGTRAEAAEAVLPETAARLLGIEPGDEVVLGREIGLGGADDTVRLAVVGTFRPRTGTEWERDPLGGAGFSPAYSDGVAAAPTYGPFVVGAEAFLESGASVNAARVTAHPALDLADEPTMARAASRVEEASGPLVARVGDDARLTRLASELPRTLAHLRAQQASTRGTVLVVLLLGSALSLGAALLVGRLVASVRTQERDLLAAMGLSRRQQLVAAGAEAALLSVVGGAVAVPAAALLHARLTHVDDLAAAGLQQGPTVTRVLLVAVVATGAVLAATLVVATTRPHRVADPSPRADLARVALDVVLVASAALAWWQLRAQPDTSSRTGDVVLTAAPVLCLAVLCVLGVRLVPALLAGVAAVARRSLALVVPLATGQAARRARASIAMVLVAAAVAAAVLALAVRTTWDRSQHDQAAARVGTDLALTLRAPPDLRDAAAVEAAVADQSPRPVVSPVLHRPLALGRYIGEPGARPVLVAVDSRHAGSLLRGRPGSRQTWAGIGAALASPAPAAGIPVTDAGTVLLGGRGPAGAALTARPTAVLEDRTGLRVSVPADAVALDGALHPLAWSTDPGADLRLVAVRLELGGTWGSAGSEQTDAAGTPATVTVSLTVPGTARDAGDETARSSWQVLSLDERDPAPRPDAQLRTDARGTQLRATIDVDPSLFDYTGADVLVSALPRPSRVPVAVSEALVDAVGAERGDELSAVVGDTALELEVVAVVPTVPSAPGEVSVLADIDTVSRALVDAGRLDPVGDAWWVAGATARTARALESTDLGTVATRAGVAAELSRGPLRVAVPTVLLVLVAMGVALYVASVVLVVGADGPRGSAAAARLRALGVRRRDAGRIHLAEHLLVLVPLTLVGALVGAAASVLVGPHLVRSDVGAAPVPPAVVAFPWQAEAVLLAGLLLAAACLTWGRTLLTVRGSEPSRLREEEP